MEINDSFVHEKLSDEQRLAVEKLSGISKIEIIDAITIGRSGASVFVVDVAPESADRTKGRCILKIDESGSGDSERKRHEDAYKTVIKECMAELVDNSPKDKSCRYVAVLYSLAHDTLLNACPLYQYIDKNFNEAVNQISNLANILNAWNTNFAIKRESPYKLITTMLGSLLKGAKSIQNIAQENLGIKDVHELRFSGSKSILPNPIAYISQEKLWEGGKTRTLVYPWGHVHYDLHSANIISPIKGTNKTPAIIDFRKYEKEFITLYDYIYLEFDLILRRMPANTDNVREEWLELGTLWSHNLGFWFQCARLTPQVNKSILIERLEGYYARTKSLDGAFYLMCLFFIRGIEEKNPSAFSEYERYLKDSKQLSTNLTHRLNRREWLGEGYTLIPDKSISFDSQKEEPIATNLPRIEGYIKNVVEFNGEISIPPYGKTIYFRPKRHDKKFYKSDEGKKVTFNVAFTYDKPIAYDVRFYLS